MIVGLAGAHRTGKTTLARAYAEKHKVPFVQTSASGTFARLGMDPRKDYPFGVRLMIQAEILADCEQVWRKNGDSYITDRTPLDLMAYTVADVTRENVGEAESKVLVDYLGTCFKVLNRCFPCVVIVQPGISLVERRDAAPCNVAYIEHINSLVLGFMVDERYEGEHFYIPRKRLALEERVSCIEYAERRTKEKHALWLQSKKESGEEVLFN